MTSIALIGPGAIGGTVGFALLEKGRDLVVCASRKFTALARTRSDNGERKALPVDVVTSPADVDIAGWVLLCVKSHQMKSAPARRKEIMRPMRRATWRAFWPMRTCPILPKPCCGR